MTRKRRIALSDISPAILSPVSPAEPRLKKQSTWSNLPWEPGEIPVSGRGNVGSLISVSESHGERSGAYGAFLGVQPPLKRGNGYALGKDILEHETHNPSLRSKRA